MMSKVEARETFLTREEIIARFPPVTEKYEAGGGTITSEISRTQEGKIIYVVPGSTKWLVEPPGKKGKGEE